MRFFIALLFVIAFSSGLRAQTTAINIVPRPNSVEVVAGSFKLGRKTVIMASRPEDKSIAQVFNAYLQSSRGFSLKIVSSKKRRADVIRLSGLWIESGLKNGGYSLVIDPKSVQISATDDAARFYAVQSLIQLVPAGEGEVTLPAVKIDDAPRFAYRGMHLDVSRHFMPVEFVKKYIDLMSRYKFNRFHWHLTDDQGWRVEIKKYPKLTEIGSKRKESVKDRNLQPYIGDGVPVEGYYTHEQIKDVVAYAKARYITVIPEIELPGHSSAALAAYSEFGCKQDYQYKVQTTWGIFKEVYCPTEQTFKFLEEVISEVVDLFPDSPYIHIGGDEVLKDHWKESTFVQELKQKENLKDDHEVQSYFVRRMEKLINSKGKKIIGWDEILEGGVAPNATIMSWRGEKGGIEAAKAKHDVIMAPNTYVYFDYGQGDPAYEPLNIGGYISLEKVYGWNPVPKDLTADEAEFIIGGQANIWTEYLKTPDKVEYMAFPRMLALSEVLWTQPEKKDYADFQRRLAAHLPRLDKLNVNYRIPEPFGLKNQLVPMTGDGKVELNLCPFADGQRIYYTTDGTVPDEKSKLYGEPIMLELKPDEIREVKTIVLTPSGRKSTVYAATLVRREPLPSIDLAQKRPGVEFELRTPVHSEPQVRESGETKSILLEQFGKTINLKEPFVVEYYGFLNVPIDGIYEFQTDATGGVSVKIGKLPIIEASPPTQVRKVQSAILPLKAGFHRFQFQYIHDVGDASFRFLFGLKGQGLSRLYGGEFVH